MSARDDDEDARLRALTDCAARLMEYFGSVQILCTDHGPDATYHYEHGRGDLYARFGWSRE